MFFPVAYQADNGSFLDPLAMSLCVYTVQHGTSRCIGTTTFTCTIQVHVVHVQVHVVQVHIQVHVQAY